MAYSDSKARKVRSRSWTQADAARWEAQQRRQRKEAADEALRKERELAKMRTDGTLDAYLETERLKKQAEEVRYNQMVLEQKQRAEQQRLERSADARLMAGSLQSEFASAIGWKERFGQPEGDWLDDPVGAMITGYGFGEEMRTSRGIKMQVNLCLDCSNSVYHNGLSEVAQLTLRTMYLGLKMAADQLPDNSLVVNVWTWAHNDDGRGVSLLTTKDAVARSSANPMGVMDNWYANFNGEDTWIAPLFERLDGWENAYGDPSAYRLDIIITDGVLEHATDAKAADVIQERRDGTLQTVMLNFLPMEEWTESRVPKRCVQYPATVDNLIGLMRGVLGSWLVNLS